MTAGQRDLESFTRAVEALEPHLNDLVFVGGWAQREGAVQVRWDLVAPDRFAWDEFSGPGLNGGPGDRRLMLEGLASRYRMTRQAVAACMQQRFLALHHAGGD